MKAESHSNEPLDHTKSWRRYRLTRREFLRRWGIASSAITFSPFFIDRFSSLCRASEPLTRVYKVMNGDCFQNTAKLWDLVNGPAHYIGVGDVVVIKANAQWPNQGYTHTGCIKGTIDRILAIPGFAGEILICDNTQGGGNGPGSYAFNATTSNRVNNWPDKNWNELAADYQAQGKPVAVVPWQNDIIWREPASMPSYSSWDPAAGPGWTRYFLTAGGRPTYISSPIFASPLTPGRMIDMRNGVWENGNYTGRKVKAIFMPTLNNHDYNGGSEDYAGVTSAVKTFFGATEIFHGSPVYVSDDYVWNGCYSIHSTSYTQTQDPNAAFIAGQVVGTFINKLYSPILYVTAAMYSGWFNRTATDGAALTKTVLACENPATLDYISCRDVIGPLAPWLNPDVQNNTRRQILGCNSQGIGTIDPNQLEVITYDFEHPTASRLDVERKIRDYKLGTATQQDVKDLINVYMQNE
jgi:hypothetical protein